MGFFKELFAQFIDVIEYSQGESDVLVYKYPIDTKQQIENGAQLIVRQSQVAVFVYEGQITDVYEPGKHTLTTETMPITTALKNWKYGFNSPFKTDVYFISTAMHLNQKWGTTSPLLVRDLDFGVVQIRCHGKFAFKVGDPKRLLSTALTKTSTVTVDSITPQIKSTIVATIKDYIATQRVPVIDLPTLFVDYGEDLINVLQPEFEELALELSKFIIEDVSLPQDVNDAISKRASIRATGNLDDLMKYEAANSIKDFAKSEGGMAGLGASVAMGANMAQAMSGAFSTQQQTHPQVQPQSQPSSNGKFCSSCGTKLNVDARFCSGCGASQNSKSTCPSCNVEVKAGQKFCENCGGQLS